MEIPREKTAHHRTGWTITGVEDCRGEGKFYRGTAYKCLDCGDG